MDIKQCYELLELNPGVFIDELRRAYRDLVEVWHPDRFRHNLRLQKRAEEKFKEMNQAYETLASHYNYLEGKPEWKGQTQRNSEEKQKDINNKNVSSIEEFAEAGTFFVLRAWSQFLSSIAGLSKKSG